MLSFANPAALLALLGLLVPLAIHLWNRRPGRVVPVGALRWLTAGANRRMRQLHLTQWPLLLIRLLLLAVLVGLLAAPRWQRPAQPARPQVLVSPEVLTSPAWLLLRPRVDSLRRRGAELRAFTAGFPLLPDSAAERTAAKSAGLLTTDWYWPRAAEAADSFPARPIYLFTPATLPHFQGTRPALPARLHWQIVPPDSTNRPWLQAAARPRPDSLYLTVGRGEARRTSFRVYRLPWPARLAQPLRVAELPPLVLEPREARFFLRPQADSTAPAVPVQNSLRIGIGYDASRREDLRYVLAALRAAQSAFPAGYHLRIQPLPTARPLPLDSLDWLLWLSDAPLPTATPAALTRGLYLLRDADGPGQATTSVFYSDDETGTTHQLYRRTTSPQNTPAAPPVWSDTDGRPVLTLTPHGRGREYQLHTRLLAQWSSLPIDGQLPEVLLRLLLPLPAAAAHDPRQLAPTQLQAATAATAGQLRSHPEYLDLRPWAALFAGLLFGFERLLAARRSSSVAA